VWVCERVQVDLSGIAIDCRVRFVAVVCAVSRSPFVVVIALISEQF
jgi:hypothetical protein